VCVLCLAREWLENQKARFEDCDSKTYLNTSSLEVCILTAERSDYSSDIHLAALEKEFDGGFACTIHQPHRGSKRNHSSSAHIEESIFVEV
jgi:hypothetical protein